MAISKVIFNGDTLMDVTGDNPASDNMLTGTRATGANGQTVNGAVVTAPASTDNPAMDGTASPGSDDTYSRGDHVHPTDTSRAPTSHAASTTTYGAGTGTNYGHLRLSDSTSSTSGTSGGYAATPSAVKSVKDSIPSASTTSPKMDGTAAAGSETAWAKGDHVHPTDTSRAPTSHASSAATYGTGTSSNYGHLKLSDSTSSTSSTSGGIAATPAAVKAAYDLANGKQSPATTLAGYGITDAASSAELGTFVRPNLLDNAYFVGGGSQQGGGQFPINQRGSTSYTSVGYSIDRWKCATMVGSTVGLTSSGLALSTTNANQGSIVFDQYGDSALYSTLQGKTLTLSVMVESLNVGFYVQFGNDGFDIVSTGLTSHTLTIPNNFDFVFLARLFNLAGSNPSIKISAIKLEIGNTQTLAHQENGTWVLNEIPNFEVELAKCMRYYQKGHGRAGFSYAANGIWVYAPEGLLPVVMRTAPAVTFSSVATYYDGTPLTINQQYTSRPGILPGFRFTSDPGEKMVSFDYEASADL